MPVMTQPSTSLTSVKAPHPSLGRRFIDLCKRRGTATDKTYHISKQNLDNILVGAPVEIILLIAERLPPSARVLLSLSSKRLQAVLARYTDLSLADPKQKVKFLQCLEKDLPEFLTCRRCKWMYKWKPRKSSHYRCSRQTPMEETLVHFNYTVPCTVDHMLIAQEEIDLILRAIQRGPDQGLPPSYFNHDCHSKRTDSEAIQLYQHFEGRVDGHDFILARSCEGIYRLSKITSELFALCACTYTAYALTFGFVGARRGWDRKNPLEMGTKRCDVCVQDVRATLFPHRDQGLVVMKLEIWRRFSLSSPLVTPRCRIPAIPRTRIQNVLTRDLERDFLASQSTIVTSRDEPTSRPRPSKEIARQLSIVRNSVSLFEDLPSIRLMRYFLSSYSWCQRYYLLVLLLVNLIMVMGLVFPVILGLALIVFLRDSLLGLGLGF